MSVAMPPGSMVTGAALAVMQRSVAASRLRSRCAAADAQLVDETPIASTLADSPTLLQIPSLGADLAYAGGAVVGNMLLVLAVGVLLHVEATCVRPWLLKKGGAIALRTALAEWVSSDQLPGSGVVVYSLLVQPSVGAAVALTAAGGSITALGVFGLLWWMAPMALWAARVATWRPFPWGTTRKLHRESVRAKRDAPPAMKLVETFVSVSELWSWQGGKREASQARKAMEARWAALFTPYRGGYHWFLLVEWGIAIAAGIVSGAALSADDACSAAEWGGWLLVVLTIVQLALHAALRPMNTLLDLVVTITLDVVGVVGQVAAVLGSDAVADVATAIGSTLGLAITIAMCLLRVLSFMDVVDVAYPAGGMFQPLDHLSRQDRGKAETISLPRMARRNPIMTAKDITTAVKYHHGVKDEMLYDVVRIRHVRLKELVMMVCAKNDVSLKMSRQQ